MCPRLAPQLRSKVRLAEKSKSMKTLIDEHILIYPKK